MPLIHTVSPEQAQGSVKEIYDQATAAMGRVPNALQIWSSSPEILAKQWASIGYYMHHATLSFPLLTMIRMLVSQNTDCTYCVGFNESMLINVAHLTFDQIAAIKQDPATAPLPEKDLAMLLFVLKATQHALTITAEDVNKLKALGWNDSEILDGLAHGASMLASDVVFNAFKIIQDF